MMKRALCTAGVLAFAAWIAISAAAAADKLTVAIGQREIWHGAPASLGTRAGIFQKHGLDLDSLYTEGAGQTMLPVISGNIDIGVSVGTLGAMGA
jgi:NitT/TauT family transport system substrate-binding protein